ncbi:hypothetical protein IJ579_07725 [bacterium]|nr:hypothetical protein [bacterium]
MKKILINLFLLTSFVSCPAYAIENIFSLDDIEPQPSTVEQIEKAEPLEATVQFDWLDINQAQREGQINHYKDLLFNENSKIYFSGEEFKKNFSEYKKDRNFKLHYMLTNNGVTEDEDAKYCAFYYKKNTLVMYAIQYKTNTHNSFYYTAFGKLYYVDVTSEEYPNFPYTSMQYDRKGKLKSAIYFVSKDLQYMYGPNKEFQGVWYKDKMYDKNGKQALTRTNW